MVPDEYRGYDGRREDPPPRKSSSRTRLVVGILAVGVAIGFVLGFLYTSVVSPQTGGITPLFDEDQVSLIFDRTSPAVVEIDVARTFGNRTIPGVYSGSGFFVDDQGHILTNNHIVSAGNNFAVRLSNGKELEAVKLGISEADDLAVLKVDPAEVSGITPLELADSSRVRSGQMAIAIGSPFREFNSVAVGVVSGIGRGQSSVLNRPIPDMIQTDVPLNPGNSGGPLLNSDGQVIGINSSIRVSAPNAPVEDFRIGFAVPSNTAVSILPHLKTAIDLKRPWIGIQSSAVARELADRMGFPKGIVITGIFTDSPARRAGLTVFRGLTDETLGDIITAVDDVPVQSVEDMVSYLNSKVPGDEVTLTLFKLGSEREVKVTLDPWLGGT
ncbi:MAG: trypsin-like peptidase domain-containing protein [Dehalococcoidia bacterium]|nr:trypsin-like peptidase domain-containing protein [Dehalococcoidia bacterium]